MQDDYSFSFATYFYDHEWDGGDYMYCHDVDSENGRKAHGLLSAELGHGGSIDELIAEKFGSPPDSDALLSFCNSRGIMYELIACRI